MSSSPEDPKASDAGGMADEKETDEGKRKPTVEPCPDSSHDGEGGSGDIAKEPELPPSPVTAPSSPLVASGSGIRLPEFFVDPDDTQEFYELLELPTSPTVSPNSSSPVASDSTRIDRLRYFDSLIWPSTPSADPYLPESLEEHGPEISLGGVEGAEQAFVDVDDVVGEIPYVGDVESLSSLADEYQSGTSIFQKKIELLRAKYSGIRRVKGDGNCFYRSFMFAYLEYLMESQNDAEMVRVLATVETLREKVFELGKSPIMVSNYCDVFIKMVTKIQKGKLDHMELLQSCRENMSNDLVKFHRMVTAFEMCRRKDHYAPFVHGMSNITVEEYCRRSVEPLGEESENMEIRALSDALGVPLRLENLDQSLTNGVAELIGFDIKPNNDTADSAQDAPLFTLLYRPGHYDILYPISDQHGYGVLLQDH